MFKYVSQSQKWTYYQLLNPVDMSWEISCIFDVDTFVSLSKNYSYDLNNIDFDLHKLLNICYTVIDKKLLRQKPAILSFPVGNGWEIIGFIFKYDNNGDTFIATPSRFSHCIEMLINSFEDLDMQIHYKETKFIFVPQI